MVEAAAAFRRAGQDALALRARARRDGAAARRTAAALVARVPPGNGRSRARWALAVAPGDRPAASRGARQDAAADRSAGRQAPGRLGDSGAAAHALAPPLPPPLEAAASRRRIADAARGRPPRRRARRGRRRCRCWRSCCRASARRRRRRSRAARSGWRSPTRPTSAPTPCWPARARCNGSPAFRRAQGRHSTEPLGTRAARRSFGSPGRASLGRGRAPARWLPLSLAEDVLYVREDRVLAFDGHATWEAGAVPGDGLRMLQFRGRGIVGAASCERAGRHQGDRGPPDAARRRRAWSAGSGAWCRTARGAARTDASPFQLACQGEGVVLLDTREGADGDSRWRTCGASSRTSPTW